ncbi:hypothetical protein A4R26_24925 [Niastella populi]|uniref:Uncharacterized protein n=1 Tax=Niastella populi TaxID=550983 RepID=A0A1V9FG79_9BACT|nr:hypothetical protein A4R26_24925 [Niastella populi]
MLFIGVVLNDFLPADCKSQAATKTAAPDQAAAPVRERINLNAGWKFMKQNFFSITDHWAEKRKERTNTVCGGTVYYMNPVPCGRLHTSMENPGRQIPYAPQVQQPDCSCRPTETS